MYLNDNYISNNKNKPRYHTLDEIRGFLIFCMVFYHAFYLMSTTFSMKLGHMLLNFFMPFEPTFAGLFIMISGLCCNLSHSNLQRGIKLLLIALTISLITYFLGNDCFIAFGILHMLSICMIIFAFANKLIKKVTSKIGMLFCVLFFVLTLSLKGHKIGIPGIWQFTIPSSFYGLNFLFPFGIYNSKFYSADYFPLFPWMFVFFFGSFLGKYLIDNKLIHFFDKMHCMFFDFLGRHSLLIYIVHQPIIFSILWLYGMIV